MRFILVSRALHRQQRRIFLQFEHSQSINKLLRSVPGARWSRTKKCWHIPDSSTILQDIGKMLPEGWQLTEEGVVPSVNSMPRKQDEPALTETGVLLLEKSNKRKASIMLISDVNLVALQDLIDLLRLKAYSESTVRTYSHEFMSLLYLLRNRPVNTLSADEVRRYILYCIETLHLSENTVHSRLNALKFYFEQVLKREKIFVEIPRPKKPFILPKVLGEQEISRLFQALDNKKHKAILFTAYSAGLRVSEAVSLRISDIDTDRMQIFVRKAKGKKDRYVMLSPVLLDILRNYMRTWKPRPKEFLFEGDHDGEHISIRTAQAVFFQARQRAGIRKSVSFHSLRHSFATHLLEQGIDVKYIKELLGHFSIQTTNRYLHVKREQLIAIRSPLDEIYHKSKWDI